MTLCCTLPCEGNLVRARGLYLSHSLFTIVLKASRLGSILFYFRHVETQETPPVSVELQKANANDDYSYARIISFALPVCAQGILGRKISA